MPDSKKSQIGAYSLNNIKMNNPLILGACFDNATCLNGGSCVQNLCICAPGYLNDVVGYAHQQNCSLPSSFLLYFFIVSTVLTGAAVLTTLWFSRSAKKLLKMFRNFFLAWLILDWLAILAVFVEEGFYEAAAVVTVIYTTIATMGPAWILFQVLQTYFRFLPKFNATRFIFWFQAGMFMWNLVTAGLYFACAVFARKSHEQNTYNGLIGTWLVFQGLCQTGFISVFAIFLHRFIALVKLTAKEVEVGRQNSDKIPKINNAVERLQGILNTLYILLPFGLINTFVGIAFFTLGNLPYLWILWLNWMIAPLQNFPNFLKMLRDEKTFTVHMDSSLRTNPSKVNNLNTTDHSKESKIVQHTVIE